MVELSPSFVLIVGSVFVAGSVAVLSWRQRPEPGAISLTVLMLAAAWWSATHLGMLVAETLPGTLLWARLQWFGSLVLPVAWVVFALEYTGRDKYVRPSLVVALLILPLITVVFLWTNGSHGLVRETAMLVERNGYLVLESTWGPWFFLIVGYAYLLATVGSLLFVQLAVGSSLLYRSQAAALLVGAGIPWLAHLVYLSDLTPWAGLDLMAISFSGSGVVLLFALSRAKLLVALPAASRLASEFVIEGIDDGVIVADSRGQIVDLNPSATTILETSAVDALGKPIGAVVSGWNLQDDPYSEVAIETDDSIRYFDIRTSALEDYHGRSVGRAVVLRDVTERRLHRQRLTVLHRILRHNLRNEMTIIRGHAEHLENEGHDSVAAINESATRIIDLSDKAAQIERMTDGRNEQTTVQLDTSIIEIVQSLRCEFPETEFITHDFPSVRCGSPIETVIRNLAENAALHNTNDDPTVTIKATFEDETVQISVIDNGPGIPSIEQQTLQSGTETPLHHGSGIGLWLVNWAVGALGGTVAFAQNSPVGTVVIVRVPVAEPLTDTGDSAHEVGE